jgi:hypothetical protein
VREYLSSRAASRCARVVPGAGAPGARRARPIADRFVPPPASVGNAPVAKTEPSGPDGTVSAVSRNDELERYRAAVRRRLITEFVERWGVCERGHVLTDLNRDRQGRCWCCTRAYERAFETSERGVWSASLG